MPTTGLKTWRTKQMLVTSYFLLFVQIFQKQSSAGLYEHLIVGTGKGLNKFAEVMFGNELKML